MAVVSSRLVLLFLSAICILIAPAIAGPTSLRHYCPDSRGKKSSVDSTYEAYLNHVLSSNTEIDNGFYNSSYGENPEKVYAIGLCRGDVEPDVCHNCFNTSKIFLTQHCHSQKEGIVWYDECMFRYSDRNIFNTMEDTPEVGWANIDTSDVKVEFKKDLWTLLESLRGRAAAGDSLGRKFATGDAQVPNFQTIYGLVQCTPDLSQQDCSHCLCGAIENFWKRSAWQTGGRILRPSCNFRYEVYGFYNPKADAPPPVKGTHRSRTVIIIVVAAVVALVIIISICIYYLRVRKPREKPEIQLISSTSTSSSMDALILPSSSKFRWDVFLNFRGSDTRKSFIDHLYSALVRAGIHTFRDDEGLPGGETISTELLNAILESRISIVVFSKDYASSNWCLDELVHIVNCKKFRGLTLLPVFYHVVPLDVERQDGTFREAFARHIEDTTNIATVQKWREALTEVAKCSGYDVDSIENGHESKVIEKIVEKVLQLKATGRTKSKYGIAPIFKSSNKCIPF